MGIGDLTSGEDCCLRQGKEKVIELRRLFVIFSCLPSTHGLGSRSSRTVHSFITYPCSNVLGKNTQNFYSTQFTTGTPLAATSHDTNHTIEYHRTLRKPIPESNRDFGRTRVNILTLHSRDTFQSTPFRLRSYLRWFHHQSSCNQRFPSLYL